MTTTTIANKPRVVSREDWLRARRDLLEQEKAATRARDALNAERRRLPMVRIEKPYVFRGPQGRLTLRDLFDGATQLIVSHFMFDPAWEKGCSSCSAGADEMSDGLLRHLRVRDTNLVYVARAPIEKIEAYKASRGWTFPFVSSYGSDFNYDFHVTLDESVAPPMYNYRAKEELERAGQEFHTAGEQPGMSCFLRDGDDVFHTYSTFGRGVEGLGGSFYFLDMTALGRQEEWEEPKGRADRVRDAIPDFSS